jgi:hypothetical protein
LSKAKDKVNGIRILSKAKVGKAKDKKESYLILKE